MVGLDTQTSIIFNTEINVHNLKSWETQSTPFQGSTRSIADVDSLKCPIKEESASPNLQM